MQVLRDYQLEAADKVLEELQRVRSTSVIWATGLGKSTLAAELVWRWHPKPTLFVCERKELVEQAADRIRLHTGLQCGIERGDYHCQPDDLFGSSRPIVASIQSLNSKWGVGKRMHKFKPSLVIVDEFHHSAAPQYEHLFNYLGPEVKLVGLSATPKRLDGKALGKHFETVAHKLELKEAIDLGWLCEIAQEYIQVKGLDYSKIKTVRGDLDPTELAKALEPEEIVQRMCQPSLEIVFGVLRGALTDLPPNEWGAYLQSNGHEPFRTVMFCASVRHAEMASEVFNRAVPGLSDWVCGETPVEHRQDKMKAFRSGSCPVMTNCDVLGEGVDVPQIEVVLQGRPTKSLSKWMQQFGRGSRTLPGTLDKATNVQERREAIQNSLKRFVRVVDFVGNSGRHKLISSVDVLGGDLSESVKTRALADAIKKGKPVAMAATLATAVKDERQEQESKRAEEDRKRHLNASVYYNSKAVNPFANTKGQPEFWKSRAKPTGPPASVPQMKILARAGINHWGWTINQAKMIIGLLVKNRWKLPQDSKYDWIRNHGNHA